MLISKIVLSLNQQINRIMKTFELNSFKNNFLGTENHVITRIEVRKGKKYTSTEFETTDINRAKSKLEYLKALGI